MVTLSNLTYKYRKGPVAVNGVTASIGSGIHLLLGENGAGKTTLLHLLAGLLRPQQGVCDIDGADVADRAPSVLDKVFFLPDSFECPFRSVNVMARRHAQFYPHFSAAALRENLRAFGMTGDERIKSLSLGTRRKAYVAYALALGVDLLLLDEPANGLDIDSKKELRRMMSRCVTDEQTVIISTHTVSDLQSIYDGLMLLSHGDLLVCCPGWHIAERLNFVAASSPVAGAIYQEPDAGLFRAILPNSGDSEETDINYGLLYSAVMSDARDAILSLINDDHER